MVAEGLFRHLFLGQDAAGWGAILILVAILMVLLLGIEAVFKRLERREERKRRGQ